MAKYTKESVLALIEEFYGENGRPPRMDEMNSQHGLPTIATFKRLTGTTPGQHLRGKHPETKTTKGGSRKGGSRKDKEAVIEGYRRFFEEYGRMPTAKDCKEKKLAYPATFKNATGSSPWAFFRDEQIQSSKQRNVPETSAEPAMENEPFILELLKRLGTSVNDVSIRTGIPAQQIRELLGKEPSQEFQQLYAIARALNVPMEILHKGQK